MWPSETAPESYGDAVEEKVFSTGVLELAAGEDEVIDARGMAKLTVITGTGATATISRVDAGDAASDGAGPGNESDVTADTKFSLDVDWPFYRITSTGGPTRVGLV